MKKFAIEVTYIGHDTFGDVPHTKVYEELEKPQMKGEFQLIRDKHPDIPVQVISSLNGGCKKTYGPEYDFDSLTLTVDVKYPSGKIATFLCRKHWNGMFRINSPFGEVVVIAQKTVRRTEEQLEDQRIEGDFDYHLWFEDVMIEEVKT